MIGDKTCHTIGLLSSRWQRACRCSVRERLSRRLAGQGWAADLLLYSTLVHSTLEFRSPFGEPS
jgi:hypothetical protein